MDTLKDKDRQSSPSDSSSIGFVLFLVLVMVLLMGISTIYPFPDGKSLSVTDFILLWSREILIVGLFVIIGFAWLFQIVRKKHIRRETKS